MAANLGANFDCYPFSNNLLTYERTYLPDSFACVRPSNTSILSLTETVSLHRLHYNRFGRTNNTSFLNTYITLKNPFMLSPELAGPLYPNTTAATTDAPYCLDKAVDRPPIILVVYSFPFFLQCPCKLNPFYSRDYITCPLLSAT